MPKGKHRQQSKKALLEEVMEWIKEKPEEAKVEFEKSALEVIQVIQQIQSSLK